MSLTYERRNQLKPLDKQLIKKNYKNITQKS